MNTLLYYFKCTLHFSFKRLVMGICWIQVTFYIISNVLYILASDVSLWGYVEFKLLGGRGGWRRSPILMSLPFSLHFLKSTPNICQNHHLQEIYQSSIYANNVANLSLDNQHSGRGEPNFHVWWHGEGQIWPICWISRCLQTFEWRENSRKGVL